MTIETLLRLSGLALLLNGILATIGFSLHPHDAAGSNHTLRLAAHVVVMSGTLLATDRVLSG